MIRIAILSVEGRPVILLSDHFTPEPPQIFLEEDFSFDKVFRRQDPNSAIVQRMKFLIAAFALFLPVLTFAQGTSVAEAPVDARPQRMPGIFRLGLLGSYQLTQSSEKYENASNQDKKAGSLALMLGLGNGMFSLEAGVALLKFVDINSLKSSDGTPSPQYLVNSQYLCYPILVKWNYIEQPLASFFVKAGIMPLTFLNQPSDQLVKAASSSTLAVVGIGGTAAMSRSAALILDITGTQNMGPENAGIPKNAVSLGLGVSFDI